MRVGFFVFGPDLVEKLSHGVVWWDGFHRARLVDFSIHQSFVFY